ncbi:LLM class flavin-dependent oxidoreductase [Algoriphagus sp. SE2]|uniref:LLM class flavin-dependent oxidoreductase n=1 Tax=Algoriphagus sp. SE2 TaxID=3141536 RepID=UPI0031CD7BA8
MSVPYSILDLSIIREDFDAKDAYERSLQLACLAEQLGYTRMWLAEHHNMANVGSSAPQILIGYLANGTSKIRLGSGGIMLPNHSPLIIAEQFGTLATLYPNRIDLGLGRAPGTDQTTANILRRGRMESVQDFPNDLDDLQRYFSVENANQKVRAFPAEGLEVPIYLLGSSMSSAVSASQKGLPYAFASHFAPGYLINASRYYRENFQASEALEKPYFISCVNVIAADTDEEAHYLATSFYQTALGIIRGKSYPMKKPVSSMVGIWTEHEASAIQNMMACTFIGSKETLKLQFESFFKQVEVDELMVSTNIYEPDKRLRSLEITAELFQ